MALSKRHRYKSRRERLERNIRNWRMGFLFVLIALVLLAIKNRVAIRDWLSTYFY